MKGVSLSTRTRWVAAPVGGEGEGGGGVAYITADLAVGCDCNGDRTWHIRWRRCGGSRLVVLLHVYTTTPLSMLIPEFM